MAILFIILFIIAIYGMKYSSFHEDYGSPKSTNAIKGIFAIIILYSHMRGYIQLHDSYLDTPYEIILRHIGQLMVAMYLFYSGYGIMESVKRKPSYTCNFPRKRILKTLVHFDIAVACYALLNIIIGTSFSSKEYLLCWVGWESIGNSNWFICVILLLYIITYIALTCTQRLIKTDTTRHKLIPIIVTLLSIVFWMLLYKSGKGSWWYDTILTFPLGMWYSMLRNYTERNMRKPTVSWLILCLLIVILMLWHFRIGNDRYGLCACIFCIVLTLMSTKVKFDNTILQWLGTQAFAIYIMQRLPMNIYEHLGWNENPYLFALITIPSVLLISWIFTRLLNEIDNYI